MTTAQANNIDDAPCPVCAGTGKLEDRLAGRDTRRQLADVFGTPPPDTVDIPDYTMHACEQCGLVFSCPMRPGDGDFYQWITGFPRYHAKHRWEWRAIRSIIANDKRPLRLLEIGCGSGTFLESIAGLDHVTAVGVDQSASSVAMARTRGIRAHESSVEELQTRHPDLGSFDVIVATHLLEHVADPRGFVQNCANALSENGYLLISTPYSPLSRELLRNDVMNLPPHHMTRWNASAFRKLAEVTKFKIGIHAPRAKPAVKRAMRQACIRVAGKERKFPVRERLAMLAAHPGLFFDTLAKTRARERMNGRIAPDKILVKLTKLS